MPLILTASPAASPAEEGELATTISANPHLADRLVYVRGDLYAFRANDLLPIAVHIALEEDGSHVVTNPETGVFGCGRTVSDALRDLHAALWDHFNVLCDDGELSTALEEQRTFLREHLRRG